MLAQRDRRDRATGGASRMAKWIWRIGVALLALLVLAAVAGSFALRGSLPQLDGRASAPGLGAAA
jgi:penicillin amidase